MRTREDLDKARQPEYELARRGGNSYFADVEGRTETPDDIIPKLVTAGETYQQQILEVLIDIRDLLTSQKPEL